MASDASLVQEVLSRRTAAMDEFVRRMRCLARFLAALNARSGGPFDEHELADLVQETLLVVWRKLATFHGADGLELWVLRIARYEFMNAMRKKSRRSYGRQEVEADGLADGAGRGADLADRMLLLQGMQSILPAEERVIRLKHFSDLTFDEIGARLAISSNTAKTRYYRGLRKLNGFLQEEERKSER